MIKIHKLTDEEIISRLMKSGVLIRFDGLKDVVLELVDRYNNKKAALTATENLLKEKVKECEAVEKARDYNWSLYTSRNS